MDSRILLDAVTGLSPEEQVALRRMGGNELAGAAQAVTAGVQEQMSRMMTDDEPPRSQHVRLVKP